MAEDWVVNEARKIARQVYLRDTETEPVELSPEKAVYNAAEKALREARREGERRMRERAAKKLEVLMIVGTVEERELGSNLAIKNGAKLIRDLPLYEEPGS